MRFFLCLLILFCCKSINCQSNGTTNSTTTLSLSGFYTIINQTVTNSNQVVISTTSNQSGIVIIGSNASVSLYNFTVNKTGDTTSNDSSNLYGLNAAVVAQQGALLNISNSVITSNSQGSTGIFSTGSGSQIYVSNVTIHTYSDSSRGLDATQLGNIQAADVTITTQGVHCSGLANDQGTGTIVATRINIQTSGQSSPVIYSTGSISATQVNGYASASEAAIINGPNNISLAYSNVTGSTYGVMLYQPNAIMGNAAFSMTNGYLMTTSNTNPLFYITNTFATISLMNVTVRQNSGLFLVSGGGSWGTNGSNGAQTAFMATQQMISGEIQVDYLSTLSVFLLNNSYFSGIINQKYNAAMMTVIIDASSTWNVTGTSYVSMLANNNTNMSNIIGNGFTVYYYASSNISNSSNLGGLTYNLTNGGYLKPITTSNNQTANAFVPGSSVQTTTTMLTTVTTTSTLVTTTTSKSDAAIIIKNKSNCLIFMLVLVAIFNTIFIF